MLVQKFARKMLARLHSRKFNNMQESFIFFANMKTKMQTDSQILIAWHFRKYLKSKRQREEIERLEEERKQASALRRRKAQ